MRRSSAAAGAEATTTDGARYDVELDLQWGDPAAALIAPPGAHTGNSLFVVHNGLYHLFEPGDVASPGLQLSAEWGRTDGLMAEARGHPGVDQLWTHDVVDVPARVRFPGVTVSHDFPLVSFATMVAPSPDWFTGAASVSLLMGGRDGAWANHLRVPLWPLDAGTARGRKFQLEPKIPEVPARPIAPLDPHIIYPRGLAASARQPLGFLNLRRIE